MAQSVSIAPVSIEKEGPGIDLSSLPTGIAFEMSDPEPGLGYARDMVTLTYDLSGFENVALPPVLRPLETAGRTGATTD
ncbi:MAG TPA: hypothetical protein VM492_03235 [Sumerlaeia bacterium]|nr:hypothetical protein [Sumerlaeia bacterium]